MSWRSMVLILGSGEPVINKKDQWLALEDLCSSDRDKQMTNYNRRGN